MLSSLLKSVELVGWRRMRRFLAVAGLAILVSFLEAVSAVLVLALLQMMLKPGVMPELPAIGEVSAMFPGMPYSEFVLWSCAVFAGFFVLRAAVVLFHEYALTRVVENTGVQLSSRLVKGYFAMPYEFHLQRNSAELMRNAHDSVHQVTSSVLRPVSVIFAEAITVVVMIAVLVVAAPLVALLATLLVALVMVLTYRFVKGRLRELGEIRHAATRAAFVQLQQGLGGVRDIKILGREHAFGRSFYEARKDLARAMYRRSVFIGLPRQTIEVSFLLLILSGLVYATLRGDVGSILTTLGFFAYAGMRIQPSLQKIASGFNNLRFADAAVDDLQVDLAILDLNTSTHERQSGPTQVLPFERSVCFDDVSFQYAGESRKALQNVELTIARGMSLGICGPTGSGKTTLVDLLSGLLLPSEGVVLVDGVDMSSRSRAWQRNIAMVHQTSFLVDDTLRRNIAFGENEERIDEESLTQAVQIAQLADVVAELPDGLDTVLGEQGVRLSGGQRQRVTLARAIYRRPRMLILDEGTSALDNATEADVMRGLDGLVGDMTLVMVAHRLSSIRRCDRIVYVEDGRIEGAGAFDELMRHNARFRAMSATQGTIR